MRLLLLSALIPHVALAQDLLPPSELKALPKTKLGQGTAGKLRKKLQGSWKITGYHVWDTKAGEYVEVAKRRARQDQTVETWMLRPDGSFRHIMGPDLWFSGRWEVKEGLGAAGLSQSSAHLVLALDISGTMKGSPIESARSAAQALLKRLGPKSRVSLVTFGTEIESLGFKASRAQVGARLQKLQARAMETRLYDGLERALSLAASAPKSGRSIVLISDGKDEGSKQDLFALMDRAENLKIPVHTVGFTRIDRKYLSGLKALSRASGGSYQEAADGKQLGQQLATVFERVVPAGSSDYFVLHTYRVRGSIPSLKRAHDWFIGTWLDGRQDLVLYYVGTRWDRSHRNSLKQAHRFEAVRYGER